MTAYEELDEISLRFLNTGRVDIDNTDEEEEEYDPYTHGCRSCGASCDCIMEDMSQGQVICTQCGIAVINRILIEKEWNDYQDDQGVFTQKSRCTTWKDPTNPFDKGEMPMFPKGFKQDFIGKDGKKRSYDMSRLNVRHIPHKQKDFWHVSNYLKESCIRLGCIAALNTAKSIWAIIAKSDVVCRGANRRGLIGNSLLFACHKIQTARTQDAVAGALYIPSSEITKGRKIFKDIMVQEGRDDIINLKTHEKSQFTVLANSIGVPRTHWGLVSRSETMYETMKHDLSILAPSSGIAGVLYYNIVQAKLKVTKAQIKTVCDVCTPTLNKALKIIERVMERNKNNTNY